MTYFMPETTFTTVQIMDWRRQSNKNILGKVEEKSKGSLSQDDSSEDAAWKSRNSSIYRRPAPSAHTLTT